MFWNSGGAALGSGNALDAFRLGTQHQDTDYVKLGQGGGSPFNFHAGYVGQSQEGAGTDGCGQSTAADSNDIPDFPDCSDSVFDSCSPHGEGRSVFQAPIRATATAQQALVAQATVSSQRTPVSTMARPFIPVGRGSPGFPQEGRRLRGNLVADLEPADVQDTAALAREAARALGAFSMTAYYLGGRSEEETTDDQSPERDSLSPVRAFQGPVYPIRHPSAPSWPPATSQSFAQPVGTAQSFAIAPPTSEGLVGPDSRQGPCPPRSWAGPDSSPVKARVERISQPPPPFKWPYSETTQQGHQVQPSVNARDRLSIVAAMLHSAPRGRSNPHNHHQASPQPPSRMPSRTPSPVSPSDFSMVSGQVSSAMSAYLQQADGAGQKAAPSTSFFSPSLPMRTPSRTPSPFSEGLHVVGHPATTTVIQGRVHVPAQPPVPTRAQPAADAFSRSVGRAETPPEEAHVVPRYVIEQPKTPFCAIFCASKDSPTKSSASTKRHFENMPVRHTFIQIPEDASTIADCDGDDSPEDYSLRRCESAPELFGQDKRIDVHPVARHRSERRRHARTEDFVTLLNSPHVDAVHVVPENSRSLNFSVGSVAHTQMQEIHFRSKCKPCAYFFHKEDGCRMGDACTFCHLCPPEELKKRKKQKAIQWKKNRARSHREALKEAMKATASDVFSEPLESGPVALASANLVPGET